MMTATIQKELEHSFRRYAHRIAIDQDGWELTYAELERSSARIAWWAAELGIPRGTFIAVMVEDRADLIGCMLGIMRAGCVFVPLELTYPNERIAYMLSVVEVDYVIHDEQSAVQLRKIADLAQRTMHAAAYSHIQASAAHPTPFSMPEYRADDASYVYFTSGSTGKPKAIVGKNDSLVHFMRWQISQFGLSEGLRVSQLTPPCHDPFLRDVLVPLLCGGTICLPGGEDRRHPLRLARWLANSRVSLVHCTPSLFRMLQLNAAEGSYFPALTSVFLAGEPIHPNELRRWYETIGTRVQLVNLYGPTETTLAKLFHCIEPADAAKERIPIGRPITDTTVYLIDESGRLIRDEMPGEPGELYIKTTYRTHGYCRDDALNQAKFIVDPVADDDVAVYKTGDLGAYLPDGSLVFLGRADRQVKIRGYRVEMGEIENTLLEQETVREAVAVLHECGSEACGGGASGEGKLAAYVVLCASARGECEEQLREFVASRLPAYMVPDSIVIVASIPLTDNGKINYEALPVRSSSMALDDSSLNEIEQRLAAIWRELLGVGQVGREDHFTRLGGNSIKVMSLISAVYSRFHIELPLSEIFRNDSLASMAAYIGSSGEAASSQLSLDSFLPNI